jgi:hypothetical protein
VSFWNLRISTVERKGDARSVCAKAEGKTFPNVEE